MIEFYLSSDGKHTVHLSAETAEELNRLSPVARTLYEGIVASYGNKPEMWQKVISPKPVNQPATVPAPAAQVAAPIGPQAPICPVHGQPMRLRQGRRGSFWSCSAKDEWGVWCTQTKNAA
jgi:hypothetical protein